MGEWEMKKVHRWTPETITWPMGGFHLTACKMDCDFVEHTTDDKNVTCLKCKRKREKQND